MTASMLLMSALMLISCEQTGDDINMDAGFYVSLDKNVIQSNGTDVATLSATLDGKDVTAETVFYLQENMQPIGGNKFSADTTGTYQIIGSYLTFHTKDDPVAVTAIDAAIPSAAADPDASKTSFVRRAFLNQYTGIECGGCPGMILALRSAFEDEETKNMAVLAAVHSYGNADPAHIAGPRTPSYPYLEIDMCLGFTYDKDPLGKGQVLKTALQERTSVPAKVGISANPLYEDEGSLLVVTVAVKAAEAGNYNLGVWFLQDRVYGRQTDDLDIIKGDPSYNWHDNCVRSADSRYMNSFAGYPIGNLKKGETAERTFVLEVKKTAWRLEDMNNIHFAAFVTTRTDRGYNVENVVDCRYNEPTPFEYK